MADRAVFGRAPRPDSDRGRSDPYPPPVGPPAHGRSMGRGREQSVVARVAVRVIRRRSAWTVGWLAPAARPGVVGVIGLVLGLGMLSLAAVLLRSSPPPPAPPALSAPLGQARSPDQRAAPGIPDTPVFSDPHAIPAGAVQGGDATVQFWTVDGFAIICFIPSALLLWALLVRFLRLTDEARRQEGAGLEPPPPNAAPRV